MMRQYDGTVYRKRLESGEYEDIESLMRRFKKSVKKSEKLLDLKKHEFYESKSIKRRKKHEAAVKRDLRERLKQSM